MHSSVKVNKIKIAHRIKHHAQFLQPIFQQVAVSHNAQEANAQEVNAQEHQEPNANNAELIFP
jgi:hypothetical protein